MSERNVEVVRRWFRSLEDGHPAPELCDPDVEITNWTDFPIRGPYRGHLK